MHAISIEFLDAVFPVMLYPDDIDARTSRYVKAIYEGSDESLQAQWLGDSAGRDMLVNTFRRKTDRSASGPDTLDAINRLIEDGNFAALVLLALAEMERNNLQPSVNQAIRLACKEERFGERKLRALWTRYKAVAPLWAAWCLVIGRAEDAQQHSPPRLPRSDRECYNFANISRFFFNFAYSRLNDEMAFEKSVKAVAGFDLLAGNSATNSISRTRAGM
jgi:hypothetical protein